MGMLIRFALGLCLAVSASAASANTGKLRYLIEECVAAVVHGSEVELASAELIPTRNGLGWTSLRDVQVESGSVSLIYLNSDPTFGHYCGLFGYTGSITNATLRWQSASPPVRDWHGDLVRAGWAGADLKDEKGFAAIDCSGDAPWVFAAGQPLTTNDAEIAAAPFVFKVHRIEAQTCDETALVGVAPEEKL